MMLGQRLAERGAAAHAIQEIGDDRAYARRRSELFRGKGCDECRGTGYRGRSGIYELFTIDEDARSLILRHASTRDIRQHAIQRGMVTLRMDGYKRACEGVTTIEEILRVTQEDA